MKQHRCDQCFLVLLRALACTRTIIGRHFYYYHLPSTSRPFLTAVVLKRWSVDYWWSAVNKKRTNENRLHIYHKRQHVCNFSSVVGVYGLTFRWSVCLFATLFLLNIATNARMSKETIERRKVSINQKSFLWKWIFS